MENTLIELGFSKNEAKVYLALLESGETAVSKIMEKTELHPQIIYNALEELRKKELVSYTIQRGRRYFSAASPKNLIDALKVKTERAEEILPKLLQKYKGVKEQSVFVYSGDEGFRKVRLSIIRSISKGGTYHVLGSGGKLFMQAMEGSYWESERVRIRREVHKRLIGFKDVASYLESYRQDRSKLEERRYFPHQYEGPTTTIFGGNKLALLVWSNPVLSILIENKELVKSYKSYFEILWQQAKPYSKPSKKEE